MRNYTKLILLYTFVFFGCTKNENPSNTIQSIRTIQTIMPEDIYSTSVKSGGIIENTTDTIFSRGLCWGTNPDPKYDKNVVKTGNGKGLYRSYIYTLKPKTTYYIRAFYITNKDTVYGNEFSFKTLSIDNLQLGYKYNFGKIYHVPNYAFPLFLLTIESDTLISEWADNYKFINATESGLGNGKINTEIITNKSGSENAAYIASHYQINGIAGWHLPSTDEIAPMSTNSGDIGQYSPNHFYWTSSEVDANYAWAMNISTGELIQMNKKTRLHIKPIKYI